MLLKDNNSTVNYWGAQQILATGLFSEEAQAIKECFIKGNPELTIVCAEILCKN